MGRLCAHQPLLYPFDNGQYKVYCTRPLAFLFLGKVRFKFSKPIDWKKVKTPKFIIQDDFGVF